MDIFDHPALRPVVRQPETPGRSPGETDELSWGSLLVVGAFGDAPQPATRASQSAGSLNLSARKSRRILHSCVKRDHEERAGYLEEHTSNDIRLHRASCGLRIGDGLGRLLH